MKKIGLAAIIVIALMIGLFLLLLGGTSPEDANAQPVTVSIDDNFER